jgi:hypothetical protein
MAYKVYLGDTSSELADLRPILMEQVIGAGMIPVQMSDGERGKSDMVDILRRKMTEADYFITIVTYKRAWEPKGMGGKSLAEVEYDLAQELGKPSAVLMPEEMSEIGVRLRVQALLQSPDDRDAQQKFWKHVVGARQVTTFTDETDLAKQVSQILTAWAGRATKADLNLDVSTLSAVSDAQAVPPAPLTIDRQNFIPSTSDRIDLLAERVAEKVANIQQKRQEELAEQAVRVNEALRLLPGELVFGRPLSGKQFKADAFMIMPFAASYTGLYSDIIKPLMADLKLTILRGDEFNSSRGVVIEEVWAALNACRFVIAEISGGNDNVFYELGIAHTLNKPAILITRATQPEDVPFDIRHLRYISYKDTAAGGAKLREDLQTTITRLIADLQQGWGV